MIYFHLAINMKNQIDISTQNAQEIGQNPTNEQSHILKKSVLNYWIIGSIIIGFSIIFGIAGYYLGKKSISTPQQTKQPSQPQISISPTLSPEIIKNTKDLIIATKNNSTYGSLDIYKYDFPEGKRDLITQLKDSSEVSYFNYNNEHHLLGLSPIYNNESYHYDSMSKLTDYNLSTGTSSSVYQISQKDTAHILAFAGIPDGVILLEKATEPSEEVVIKVINRSVADQIQISMLKQFAFQVLSLIPIKDSRFIINSSKEFSSALPAYLSGQGKILHATKKDFLMNLQGGCGGCPSHLAKIDLQNKSITIYRDVSAYGFFVENSPIYVVKMGDIYYLLNYEINSISKIDQITYEKYKKENIKFQVSTDSQTGDELFTEIDTGKIYRVKREGNGSIMEFLPSNKFLGE